MTRNVDALLWAMCTCVLLSGCTHRQLRNDGINQAKSLTPILERQVLDNLAMFRQNPNALPYFAVPGAGRATVTDSGSIGVSTLNGLGRSIIGPLGLSRDNSEAWALEPITDPDRLDRMRCAYRAALGFAEYSCPNVAPVQIEECGVKLFGSSCEKVGHYCGCYIRVCPESAEEFTALVIAILNAAVNDPPAADAKPTVKVTELFYNKDENVERIEEFTIEVDPNEVPNRRVPAMDGDAPLGRSGMLIKPRAIRPRNVNGLFQEEQLQLYRGTIFPQ